MESSAFPDASKVRAATPRTLQNLAHSLSDFLQGHEYDEHAIHRVTFAPGQMYLLVSYVLSHPRWKSAPEAIPPLLSYALVPTEFPEPGFPSLRRAAGVASKSGMCGKVWKQDELAYTCKTCESDPTCAVCVQCFKLGDHTGHDYAMIRTAGGCCDCGDAQAWRPDGFCTRHSGACAEDEDPSEDMPLTLKRDLVEAVSAVAQHVLRLCCDYRIRLERKKGNQSEDVTRECKLLLDWMADVVQCGDGIRRVVGVHLATTPAQISVDGSVNVRDLPIGGTRGAEDGSWLGVMLAIDGVDKLHTSIQERLHKLYFQLITDLVFKRAFLEKFVDNYERYIQALVTKEHGLFRRGLREDQRASTDIMETFTVQLFTVPALVPVMIRRGGLLDVLIDMLLNLFETCAAPVSLYDRDVPFAESAFANEYQSTREQHLISEPVASSSTSPQPTTGRRRHFLPLPFPTRESKRKKVVRRKRPSSGSRRRGPHEDIRRMLEGFRALHALRRNRQMVATPETGPSGEQNPPDAVGNAADQPPSPNASPAAEGVGERQETREEFWEVIETGVDDEEEEGAISVDAGENSDVRDGPAFVEEMVVDEAHGPLEAETLPNIQMIAAQLEDAGVELHFPADVLLQLREGGQGVEGEQGETEITGSFVMVRRDSPDMHMREQLAVFEDGMHFEAPPHARLGMSRAQSRSDASGTRNASQGSDVKSQLDSPSLASAASPTSRYLSAVKEARQMANAAILGTGPLAHTMRLDWPHLQDKMSDWVTWRVKHDLKYVLTHRAVAYHLVHKRKDLFRKIVRMISMAQGMNPSSRRFGDHVPMEADTWAKSFTIEIEMVYHYVELLADAFCGLGSPSMSPAPSNRTRRELNLTSSRLNCIAIVRSSLDEWIEREEALEARSMYTGETFSVAHSVSVHLPLHRFLGFMVHHVLRLDGVDLKTALSGGSGEVTADEARRLVRHPIRVQSFLGQVRAGMWRRNGRPVAGQSRLYRAVHYSEWFVDLDLFLQQCCAVIMGPEAYVDETLEAFRIADFPAVIRVPGEAAVNESGTEGDAMETQRVRLISESPNGRHVGSQVLDGEDAQSDEESRTAADLGLLPLAPKRDVLKGRFPPLAVNDTGSTLSELAGFVPTLVEDLLIHIVRVLSERSRCGLEESQFLRRKLVHQLCSKDRTHSQLYTACSFRISMELDKDDGDGDLENKKAHSLVESILPAIAEYVEPRGMEQGKYRLKDELWEEFDSFAPHLSLRDRFAAEVRHAAACKRQKRKMQVIPVDNINERRMFPQLLDLLELSMVVSRKGKGGLARELLYKALPCNGGPQSIEGSIAPALLLVCAAAEMSGGNVVDVGPRHWLRSDQEDQSLTDSALSVICDMYNATQDSDTGLFKEYEPVLKRILDQARVRGNVVVQQFIGSRVSKSGTLSTSMDADVNDDSLSKEESERRSMILRKKRAQQAAALAQMRLAQASFAKHIDSDAPTTLSTRGLSPPEDSGPTDKNDHSNTAKETRETENESVSAAKAHVRTTLIDAQEQECALCHDAGRGDGTRLMGLIGFRQKSRLPAIAQEQCKSPRSYCGEGRTVTWNNHAPLADMDVVNARNQESDSGDTEMEVSESETPSNIWDVELRESFFLDSQMLKNGVESGENLHVSFCGHFIHIQCFDRYFSSLMQSRANQSVFEGDNVLNLDKLEFLCPVCRRLANMVLPLMNDIGLNDQDRAFGMEVLSSLSFSEWIERCALEVSNGWSREYSALRIRSRLPSGSHEDMEMESGHRNRRPACSDDALRLRLSIINNCKAVLHKFGLQSFGRSHAGGETLSGEPEEEPPASSSYTKLPSAVVSTVACAEIAARTGCWGESASQASRKSLGILLRETRAQIALEPQFRKQGLSLLWKAAGSLAKKMDPFTTFAFLFLLWQNPVDFYEAKNLVRLGFNLAQLQRSEDEANSVAAQAELDLIVLLYLRRACVLVSSFFEPFSDPQISKYDGVRDSVGHDCVRLEILRLMKYFEIPTPPEPNVSVGLKEMDALGIDSASSEFRPQRIGLIRLPKLFQSLLEELDGRKCCFCEKAPKSPALCLVCGDLLCSGSAACGTGGLSTHAKECGTGIGVFLVLKKTSIQIIREDRSSNWGSPYLDAHGEEDENLDRGKPLFLNMDRYSALEHLWLTHGFDQDSRILSITVPISD